MLSWNNSLKIFNEIWQLWEHPSRNRRIIQQNATLEAVAIVHPFETHLKLKFNKNLFALIYVILHRLSYSEQNLKTIGPHRPISQIPECTSSIFNNTPFRTEMCTYLSWMAHYGIWNWCIQGFVNWVNWNGCYGCMRFTEIRVLVEFRRDILRLIM